MYLLRKFKVLGHSMEPTIQNGDLTIISFIPYLFFSPKINEIIAFKNKDKVFIKRITSISNDKFKVEGDNKKDSLDSRNFGLIEKNDILGKVIYVQK